MNNAKVESIRMKKNYKVSYKSGWLEKGNVYLTTDIEGGAETVAKLLDSGTCVIADKEAKVGKVVAPIKISKRKTQADKKAEAELKSQLRKEAAARKEALGPKVPAIEEKVVEEIVEEKIEEKVETIEEKVETIEEKVEPLKPVLLEGFNA